jgi:1-acyl-sn-glycerol-3-phosphate acyltransferase
MNWLGKHTLFRFPVAGLLRWMGGEPVDRTATKGVVEFAIERFRQRPQWVLGISPEGTRKRAAEWKSGFYRIAVGAGVPIVPVTIDYSRHVLGMGVPFRPTGDPAADELALRRNFTTRMARYPEHYAELAEEP